MRQLNKVFEKKGEDAVTISFLYNGKLMQRVAGIKEIGDGIFAGYVTANKKITGRWVWNTRQYDNPVFYSEKVSCHGRPLRITKGALNEALKDLVLTAKSGVLIAA